MSEAKTLAAALLRVHKKLENPAYDKLNPHFKRKYASLAAIRNTIHAAASEEGVFVTQDVTTTENTVIVKTIVTLGETGEFMEFGPLVLPAGGGPQVFGSACTYCRRYSLQAAFNIVGDGDEDDADEATNGAKTPVKQPKATKPKATDKPEEKPTEKPAEPDNDRYQKAMTVIMGCADLDKLKGLLKSCNARFDEGVFSEDQLKALHEAVSRREATLQDAKQMDEELTV